MRRISFDECNDTGEVCGLFNTVFANQAQMEAKIIQNAQEIEALKFKNKEETKQLPPPVQKVKVVRKTKKKGKSKMKSNGSASMRVIAILMLIFAVAGLSYAAYVPSDITYEIASNPETLTTYLRDVTSNMASDSYLFNPRTPAPLAVTGRVYYESTTDTWIGYNGTAWQTFDVAGGVGLNGAYDFGGAGAGRTILANDGAVVISNAEGDTANLLELTYTGGAGAIGLLVTIDGTEPAIEIENTSTGYDIEGTGATWYTTSGGIIVGVSGDLTGAAGLTLQNDETITNADGSIVFTDSGGNTLIFDMDDGATSILIDSGDVVTLDWGTVDNFISMETITFDDAATAAITMTGTGTNNLTISQAGTGDESLVLTSAGAAVDAVTISSTDTLGGIDIDALNDIDIQVTSSTDAEDILITQSGVHNSSIILTADGTGTDAIKLETTNAGGDIWIDSGDDLDIDVAGILDIDIVGAVTLNSAAGIDILSAEAADGAITIATSDAAGQVVITSTDTTADALDINTTGGVDVDTTDGGIALTTAGAVNGDILIDASDKITIVSSDADAEGILIQTDGGASETIHINSTAGTGATAIYIDADVGGITLLADGDAAGDILIDAEDNITITTTDESAGAITITADTGAATSTIIVTNVAGTAVSVAAAETASIQLYSTVGGIGLQSGIDAVNAIRIEADAGTAETIVIHANQGDTATSITLLSDDGGITLDSGAADNITLTAGSAGGANNVIFTNGQTRHYVIRVNDVDLDSTNPPALSSIGTDAQWRSDVLQFDSNPGGNDDVCYIQWHVPDGYIANSANLHVYWSFSTAEDAADECEIDGTVSAIAVGEDFDAAGGAMAAVASIITDASAEEGSLVKTSLDIEVVDIAVDDEVTIMFFFDESACLMANSGTADVHYFVITYESTE